MLAPYLCGDTGSLRDLQHVLWETRFTVLLQLRHWRLRAADVWTVSPPSADQTAPAQAARLFSHANPDFQA